MINGSLFEFSTPQKNRSTYVDLLTQTHNSLEISQIGLIIATTHWVKNVSIVSYFKCFASLEPYNDFGKIPDFSPIFFLTFAHFYSVKIKMLKRKNYEKSF